MQACKVLTQSKIEIGQQIVAAQQKGNVSSNDDLVNAKVVVTAFKMFSYTPTMEKPGTTQSATTVKTVRIYVSATSISNLPWEVLLTLVFESVFCLSL